MLGNGSAHVLEAAMLGDAKKVANQRQGEGSRDVPPAPECAHVGHQHLRGPRRGVTCFSLRHETAGVMLSPRTSTARTDVMNTMAVAAREPDGAPGACAVDASSATTEPVADILQCHREAQRLL
jgi:hypothetical protein